VLQYGQWIHLAPNPTPREAPCEEPANGRAFSGEPSEQSERPERIRGRRVRCNAMLDRGPAGTRRTNSIQPPRHLRVRPSDVRQLRDAVDYLVYGLDVRTHDDGDDIGSAKECIRMHDARNVSDLRQQSLWVARAHKDVCPDRHRGDAVIDQPRPNGRAFSGEPSERNEGPERKRGRRVRRNAMLGRRERTDRDVIAVRISE
jgi:hypothetical protein